MHGHTLESSSDEEKPILQAGSKHETNKQERQPGERNARQAGDKTKVVIWYSINLSPSWLPDQSGPRPQCVATPHRQWLPASWPRCLGSP